MPTPTMIPTMMQTESKSESSLAGAGGAAASVLRLRRSDPRVLALLDRHADARALLVKEERLEVGARRDGVEVFLHAAPVRARVVGEEHPADADERQELRQVVHVAALVGVEEDEVYGPLELRYLFMRVALDERDEPLDPRALEVLPRERGAAGVDLVGGELPAGAFQRKAYPDAGVAVRGPDLHNMLRFRGGHEAAQEPAVRLGHVHHAAALVLPHVGEYREDVLLFVGAEFRGRSGCGLRGRSDGRGLHGVAVAWIHAAPDAAERRRHARRGHHDRRLRHSSPCPRVHRT